ETRNVQGEKMQNKDSDVYEIDILEIIVMLLKKWWLILLAGIICAAAAFGYTYIFVTPMYKTSVMLYVNNTSISVGSAKLNMSSADLDASQKLVNTYGVILSANLTMQDIADALKENPNLHSTYNYKQLRGMISSSSANDTEIMRVTVTGADYDDIVEIANTVAEVLPKRISRIVDGTSVTIVDLAEYPTAASSPSYSKNTLVGFAAGAIIAVAAILIYNLFINDTIDSEDWIRNTFAENLPVLAVIPEVHGKHKGTYGKYSRYGKKYYGNGNYYGYYSSVVDINDEDASNTKSKEKEVL
ncbi:MAG: Wzz/FepE/Etk N-terminal domain-containing protein, partial [Bacillota bacterium]|nr:Wzz/FepE/Etk N-terminal domain-containing protein [Bacillota bacterium]